MAQRLPPSSSSLMAMSTLTLPSPTLSPSQLPSTLTSGDILIMLQHDVHLASEASDITPDSSLGNISTLDYGCVSSFSTWHSLSSGLRYQVSAREKNYRSSYVKELSCKSREYRDCGVQVDDNDGSYWKNSTDEHLAPIIAVEHRNDMRPQTEVSTAIFFQKGTAEQEVKSPSESERESEFHESRKGQQRMRNNKYFDPTSITQPRIQGIDLTYTARPSNNWTYYDFLKHLAVELMIDQEGFRAVWLSFKYVGVRRLRSRDTNEIGMDLDIAEFRPVRRDIYHFHYAPFDGLPILRRVTVSGDRAKDYTSKQAYLTLKSNGVYTVRGTEDFRGTDSLDENVWNESAISRLQRLHWHFNYVIDDRRMESGRVMEGEKTLTPLTFSCSPRFLLPQQGKKISMMHVFKKGVSSKLTAIKLEPPGITRSPNRPIRFAPLDSERLKAQPAIDQSSISDTCNLSHRRVQSHGPRFQEPKGVCKAQTQPNESAIVTTKVTTLRRRRRASSAGECLKPTYRK